MNRYGVTLFAATGLFVLVQGCNAILGNEDGKLAQGQSAADSSVGDAASDDGGSDARGTFEGGVIDAGFSCPAAKKACEQFKACVEPNDVNFGCGNPSCIACDDTNATEVKCVGTANGLACKATCKAGFADCNNDGVCESDLSKPTTCGACTKDCTAGAAKLCARLGTSQDYDCVATCPADQICPGTTECVDKIHDPKNCGACNNVCPTPTNGTASCESSTCSQSCGPTDHLCGTTCFPNGDAEHCGSSCTDCVNGPKRPPNTVKGSCQSNTCVWDACAPGYSDCDGDLSKGVDGNGCETDIWSDNFHCGDCFTQCSTIIIAPQFQGANYVPPNGGNKYCCNGTCVDEALLCPAVR